MVQQRARTVSPCLYLHSVARNHVNYHYYMYKFLSSFPLTTFSMIVFCCLKTAAIQLEYCGVKVQTNIMSIYQCNWHRWYDDMHQPRWRVWTPYPISRSYNTHGLLHTMEWLNQAKVSQVHILTIVCLFKYDEHLAILLAWFPFCLDKQNYCDDVTILTSTMVFIYGTNCMCTMSAWRREAATFPGIYLDCSEKDIWLQVCRKYQ